MTVPVTDSSIDPFPNVATATDAVGVKAASTPTAGYTNCERFSSTGRLQAFTVPDGITTINARMWGSGGGGNAKYSPGGGFTAGDVNVKPGETLIVLVGNPAGFGGGATGVAPGGGRAATPRSKPCGP